MWRKTEKMEAGIYFGFTELNKLVSKSAPTNYFPHQLFITVNVTLCKSLLLCKC